jgi:alpha-L-fucosidase
LNLPPDRRGRIHELDVEQLRQFRRILETSFSSDLARAGTAWASSGRGAADAFAPACVNDGSPDTYWAADDGVTRATVELAFPHAESFNTLLLQEPIFLGQRVQEWTLEARTGDEWKPLAAGTTIGYKRILRFETVRAESVRLTIVRAKACPALATMGVYLAPG